MTSTQVCLIILAAVIQKFSTIQSCVKSQVSYLYQFEVVLCIIKTEQTMIVVGNRILVKPCQIGSCYKMS